jgi:hypothetical protein
MIVTFTYANEDGFKAAMAVGVGTLLIVLLPPKFSLLRRRFSLFLPFFALELNLARFRDDIMSRRVIIVITRLSNASCLFQTTLNF